MFPDFLLLLKTLIKFEKSQKVFTIFDLFRKTYLLGKFCFSSPNVRFGFFDCFLHRRLYVHFPDSQIEGRGLVQGVIKLITIFLTFVTLN